MCWDPATRHQILLPTGAANCDVEGYRHIYLITSLAITPTGARRMLQSEVTQFGLPPLPAALTLPGPSPTYGSPNSSNFHIEGEDHADPDCSNVTGDPTPGIAITDATSEDDVQDAIPDNREANYTGSEGTTPDIQPLSQASMPGLYTVAELKALTELVEANANRTYYQSNPGTPVTPTLGTLSSPQVVYVEGDAVVSGSGSYSGVLFVTGTLTMDGGARFDGIIFVVGEGVLEFSGGGGGQINGGIFVAKILDNSNPPNYLSELGSPTLDWSGGGNNGIEYSTCAIKKATGGTAFTVLSSKELSY
jgi:hypothetical protein